MHSLPRRVVRASSIDAPGLALIGAIVLASFALNHFLAAVSPLTSSVALGFLVVNLVGWPAWAEPGTRLAARGLLRTGVALLGMDLSLQALIDLGPGGALAVIAVVTVTIVGVTLLARWFGLSQDLGLLIGVGFGICGASAVAAVRPQTDATEQEASYAVGLVAICGTLSIGVLPLIGAALGLSDHMFGLWAGAAVHDVGQVVATASTRGDAALRAAVIVKLARVALLAPVVLIMSVRHRRRAADGHTHAARVPLVPGFVLGFLALAAINSTGVVPASVTADVAFAGKVLIAFGLAALGLGVRWHELRKVGSKPLALGLLAWVLVAGVALLAVHLLP